MKAKNKYIWLTVARVRLNGLVAPCPEIDFARDVVSGDGSNRNVVQVGGYRAVVAVWCPIFASDLVQVDQCLHRSHGSWARYRQDVPVTKGLQIVGKDCFRNTFSLKGFPGIEIQGERCMAQELPWG